MIVVYAVGGGLGHRTRAQRVAAALQIDARIICNDDIPPELEGDVPAHRDWIRSLAADRLIADTFPCGIQGELAELESVDYIARLLRWDEYEKALGTAKIPKIKTTFVVEALARDHDHFIKTHSQQVKDLTVPVPEPAPPSVFFSTPYWLIVHSGPANEVEELIEYTKEQKPAAHVLVATQSTCALPHNFTRVETNEAHAYFANAEKIISAAGFNVMLETEPFRHKHTPIPFPRRFDDQFARAARRRLHSTA